MGVSDCEQATLDLGCVRAESLGEDAERDEALGLGGGSVAGGREVGGHAFQLTASQRRRPARNLWSRHGFSRSWRGRGGVFRRPRRSFLLEIEPGEIGEAVGDGLAVGAEIPLPDGEGAFHEGGGLGEFCLVFQQRSEAMQALRVGEVARASLLRLVDGGAIEALGLVKVGVLKRISGGIIVAGSDGGLRRRTGGQRQGA